MLASEILVAVEKRLRRSHRGRHTVYRREWSIAAGATRVDFAAINGKITGCEIKGSRDNFTRLASQVKSYSAILDTALLVVEGDSATARAQSLIPSWWGIWQAVHSLQGAKLEVIRQADENPSPDPLAITQLIWRNEAYAILQKHGLSKGLRTATRWKLWNTLASELDVNTLRHEVRSTIKARQDW